MGRDPFSVRRRFQASAPVHGKGPRDLKDMQEPRALSPTPVEMRTTLIWKISSRTCSRALQPTRAPGPMNSCAAAKWKDPVPPFSRTEAQIHFACVFRPSARDIPATLEEVGRNRLMVTREPGCAKSKVPRLRSSANPSRRPPLREYLEIKKLSRRFSRRPKAAKYHLFP